MPSVTSSNWIEYFPSLTQIRDPTWLECLRQAQVMELPTGAVVFREGDACRNYLLVLSGAVRVQKLSDSGREIVLYRVLPGESCVLTTSCLMANELYQAEALTESVVHAVALPRRAFQKALENSRGFREFVFAAYGERIAALVSLIDAIAFHRLDSRLAERLMMLAGASTAIEVTHQELARELGTAREVISRLLKEFENAGWVRLGRGHIELLECLALERLMRS
jgi:CRP/FNR family transcriptional regulator, anaerobic regulatory protein